MISQELFEEVMGFKVDSIDYNDQWEDASTAPEIVWSEDGEQIAGICIHYLAHKCKVWAYEQGYSIATLKCDNGYIYMLGDKKGSIYDMVMKAKMERLDILDTEPEAIFKACQWILENKDK